MEFFVNVPVQVSADLIKSYINLHKLSEWCDAINEVVNLEGNRALLVCEMGRLHVHRELIQDGVRFSITDSPYALQWTVTADQDHKVLIHCTLNCQQCAAEFIQQLERFLLCWENGIVEWVKRRPQQDRRPCVSCGDSFGGFG
ncbi:MAG: hypothetical protein EP315_04855 [Gammaproteobacteria bacterium]|nr:MAG: hypothetical protein EP315_04855 [Gammaproteobacteria bacterium]